MNSGYTEWRMKKDIQPVVLKNKEKFIKDIINIEHSWSGRMDIGNIGNTFIMEAAQLLVNAIELFELGYFDCAFYSLRSAVDLSTTMVFFTDIPHEKREEVLDTWKEMKNFPARREMIKQLSINGEIFIDMKEKMQTFFEDAKKLNDDLNKRVHKQGLYHFYLSRNHPLNRGSQDEFIEKFEKYLKMSISVVAVMRLAIDPFPILLMDDEILYRCFDSMTDPYSVEFVDEYIGQDVVDAYKETEIFKSTYDMFKDEERKTQAVFNVVKHQYIDSIKCLNCLNNCH